VYIKTATVQRLHQQQFTRGVIRNFRNFLLKSQLDALIFQVYSWNETLRVSDSSSVHHQEFFTVHTEMVYVIQVCWFHPDPARKLSANLYDIYHCCVYSKKLLMMDKVTAQNM